MDPEPVVSSKVILLLRDTKVYSSNQMVVTERIFKMFETSVTMVQPASYSSCVSAEISFLFSGRQLATVSALTACSLFSLSLKHFEELEEEFPQVVKELRAVAQRLKDDLEGKTDIMTRSD